MSDAIDFGRLMLVVAVVGLGAVLATRVATRLRVPAPLLVLAASSVALAVVPSLHTPSEALVERLVTVALMLILFDGGMGIGWRRFRAAAVPIGVVGVLGTFATAAGVAAVVHYGVGVGWFPSLLMATAVAPTDPAVVFSVLGRREISGRSGTILEGESGANDPVGIALMASLLAAGTISLHVAGAVVGQFALQMSVGLAVGLAGGWVLRWSMRHLPLPGEGMYPLRTLAAVFALYGVAAVGHGSGFLAVFVAGIMVGDARAPYKREVEHFHAGLASLAEVVVFVMLGLTVKIGDLVRPDVWVPGLVVGAVLAFVVRPLLVGPMLTGSGLSRREKHFVVFAGLKGAVPILLGDLLLVSGVPDAERLYGIVVVVVLFSVLVQASMVPFLAAWLRIPMREVEPEPWSLGVRLRDEPHGVVRVTVGAGAPADGHTVAELDDLPAGSWVSLVVRSGQLVPVGGDTSLQAGDEALVLSDPEDAELLRKVFERPAAE
ncbi:MAG: cation:proton antiporter [Nocardioidaceae bacterium]|nr:cation:proton antiporter [Nocardioidaceae bacterium]MCL2612548.1 cation:proton antiporter [Nocardioidaceae bacterium]